MSETIVKPSALPPNIGMIPAELRSIARWVVWKFVHRAKANNGKCWAKIPHDPKNGRRADTTDHETWGSFADAWKAYQSGGYDGIGFVFSTDDDLMGVDLDNCRDAETGTLQLWAAAIVAKFPTYAEVSASGTGVHLICRGKLPEGGRRRSGDIEMYSEGRYFAFTGRPLEGDACDLS